MKGKDCRQGCLLIFQVLFYGHFFSFYIQVWVTCRVSNIQGGGCKHKVFKYLVYWYCTEIDQVWQIDWKLLNNLLLLQSFCNKAVYICY